MKKSLAKQLLEDLNAIEKKDSEKKPVLNHAPHDKVMKVVESVVHDYKNLLEKLKDA